MSPTSLSPAPREKIADIQILRAVAILSVLLAHLSLPNTFLAMLPGQPPSPFWIGVELFFVISGFVVTKAVVEGSSMAPGRFLQRRAFRLLPAMLAFVALSGLAVFLASWLTAGNSWADQALIVGTAEFTRQSLSVLGGYFINRDGPALYTNSAMWSLSVEFQFYAGFAVVLAAISALRLSPRLGRRLIFSVAVGVYALAMWQRLSTATGGMLPSPSAGALYLTAWKFDFMALGVITYFAYRAGFAFSRFGTAIGALMLAAPIVIALACGSPLAPGPKDLLDGVGLPLMGACFAIVVLLAARESAFSGKDTLAYRAMLWVGNRSYSLYLVHYPVMAIVWVGTVQFYPPAFSSELHYGTTQALVVLPASAILSDICYRKIELNAEPIRALCAQLLRSILPKPATAL